MEPKSSIGGLRLRLLVLHLLLLAPGFATAFNYADALSKSIIFFEGQRSGKLPPGNRMPWRSHSGLSDGAQYNVDLVGGYYDAGDNVKFGLPMAFTTTMLAWSVLDFGKFMAAAGELENARAAVKWGADYLLKAATATPGKLYVQVADPNQDHRCWERPEDMDTPRGVYHVDVDKPGSDVAGETAAALAASSLVFRRSDPVYSNRLLNAAVATFEFADRHRGAYSDTLASVACPFYCSYSGYHDELLWAATWLHRANPSNSSFLSYVAVNGLQLGAGDDDFSFSWDDKRAGAKILLAKFFLRKKYNNLEMYKAHADSYLCSLVPGTASFNAGEFTAGGLLFKSGSSNMQYVTTATFLMLAYAKYLRSSNSTASCGISGEGDVSAGEIVAVAKRQVDYILGKNPAGISYMVGFGCKYPRRVHHRGASIPSVRAHPGRIGCDAGFGYLHSGEPNPNVLVGAVVGGPDSRDAFADDRGNFAQSEPATYINAPLVGALAYFAGTTRSGTGRE
uniref:Endoglucanase n=1 Tax=Leersia perrieri TaxID=77586 RepID=A0A0D9X3T7_9ORYZ